MIWQRTIGVDLAVKGTHKAAVCNEKGDLIQNKPFCFNNTLEDFESLINKFIPPSIDPNAVAFIMEPTSNIWRLLSAFLISRGYKVFLVKTQKVSDLRKYFSKYTKSDFKDATSMAKQPWVDKESLKELVLPQKELYCLERLVKQYSKLGKDISRSKNRIYAIFQILNPDLFKYLSENKFTQLNTFLFRKFANPFRIRQIGLDKFKALLLKNAYGNGDFDAALSIYNVSVKQCELLDNVKKNMDNLPFDLDGLQDELNIELNIIQFLEKQRSVLKEKISKLYKQLVPHPVLQSFKGIGDIVASVILVSIGNISRFSNVQQVKGFLGLVPRKKQTSYTDRKGLKITKASKNIFKSHVYLAAEVARQYDVQFADKYNRLMKAGKHHKQAMCALANMLITRVYSVLKRYFRALNDGNMLLAQSIQYELRDTQGFRISAYEAREIILKNYPSKKESERRLKEKKEKNATAFSTRQSEDSSKSRFAQSSPVVIKDILPQVLASIK